MRHFVYLSIIAAALALTTADAFAYIVCSPHGDCWRSPKRIRTPGIKLVYHSEDWWKKHQHDRKYRWHETDKDHSWRDGYWDRGTWWRR